MNLLKTSQHHKSNEAPSHCFIKLGLPQSSLCTERPRFTLLEGMHLHPSSETCTHQALMDTPAAQPCARRHCHFSTLILCNGRPSSIPWPSPFHPARSDLKEATTLRPSLWLQELSFLTGTHPSHAPCCQDIRYPNEQSPVVQARCQ